MLVFWKEKLVLFAVPKTGTTALEGALAPRASMVIRDPAIAKHTPVYRFRRFLRPYFEALEPGVTFETVAVIREPESWLGSWWRYRSRPDLDGHRNSTRDVSFEDFVEGYLSDEVPPFAQVGSQAKFLTRGVQEGPGVDRLYRYEALPRLYADLEDRLGVRLDPPRLNVSPEREAVLSEDTRARMRRKLRKEYRLWEAALH